MNGWRGRCVSASRSLSRSKRKHFEVLSEDPTNRSGSHDIKKLTNVPRGEGQWRLAIGRFRLRYDVYDQDVVLQYCGLRREDMYR